MNNNENSIDYANIRINHKRFDILQNNSLSYQEFVRKEQFNELISTINGINNKSNEFIQRIIDENKVLVDKFSSSRKKEDDDGMNVEDDF